MPNDRVPATDTGLPKTRDMTAIRERLARFAEWTDTTPPAKLLDGEGEDATFSDEFLTYCEETDLSLDWVWLGSAKSYALGAYNRTKREAASEDTSLPPTPKSLLECQHDAVLLKGLLEGIDLMENEGRFDSARSALTMIALDRAAELADNLDRLDSAERRAGA